MENKGNEIQENDRIHEWADKNKEIIELFIMIEKEVPDDWKGLVRQLKLTRAAIEIYKE